MNDPVAAAPLVDVHPPRPVLCCTLGVTGHRADMLAEAKSMLPGARIEAILRDVADAIAALASTERDWFAPVPPRLRLLSPLAPGADQIAAAAALDTGYALSAVLPFERAVYADDFDGEDRARHDDLLAHASGVLELPGSRDRSLEAYVMAGRATVAHADLMIAVWDGLPARGRGGTGEVVELALRSGKPVVHVPLDDDAPVRLLWAGFDPLIVPTQAADAASRSYDRAVLGEVVARMFAPPAIAIERAQLAAFIGERERLVRPRIEYPLLLAATGVRRFGRAAWRTERYAGARCGEWDGFRTTTGADRIGHAIDTAALETSYCWADRLAQHYAQTYRSGHVLNFVFGALAVLLALGGLLIPGAKLWLASGELILIATIVANTRIGAAREWHRRWLDYRYLAEHLRPMRSLTLFAIAQPVAAPALEQRWNTWFAAAAWRMIDPPTGRIDRHHLTILCDVLLTQELQPQIDYHHANAAQLKHLDHQLHRIGTALFVLSIAICAAFIIGYFFANAWVVANARIFIFLSAGLPTMGGAIFGIRVQGEFAGTAQRSLATADRLAMLAETLRSEDRNIARAGDLIEAASATMLSELAEWRVSYSQRKLVLPA